MKISDILEMADKPLTVDEYIPVAAVMEDKLREIMEIMPSIITSLCIMSASSDMMECEAAKNTLDKLKTWMEE